MAKKYARLEAIEAAWGCDGDFHKAYGRFMIAWADAEAELYRVLKAYAKVSDAVARAIFSGTRAGVMIDFIRAIAHNTEMPEDRRSDLEHVFRQMREINSMRDTLAHHASDSYGIDQAKPTDRLFTNSDRVSRYGNERIERISVETLNAMTEDLYGISNHLNMHWGPRTGPFRPWRENDKNDPPTPWLYKPLQSAPPHRKSPSGARKREGPQKPSRGKS